MKKKKPKARPKREPVGVVVISDLHIGGSTALWPPDGKLSSGNTVGFGSNRHQEWLWSIWQNTIKTVKEHFGKDPWVLVLNGDLVDGIHHANKEVTAAIEADHMEAAIEVIRPLHELAQTTRVVRGTECHVKDFESVIAKQLGAEFAGDKLLFEVHGTLIDVKHHMPTSSRAYLEAGPLSIVMGNALQNYLRVRHRPPRVFLRGHRHVGGVYSDGTSAIVSTGAYQLLTRWAFKVVPDSICRPAFAILDWRGRPKDSVPAITLPTYDPEQEQIVSC
jgi:hypothetical protein